MGLSEELARAQAAQDANLRAQQASADASALAVATAKSLLAEFVIEARKVADPMAVGGYGMPVKRLRGLRREEHRPWVTIGRGWDLGDQDMQGFLPGHTLHLAVMEDGQAI